MMIPCEHRGSIDDDDNVLEDSPKLINECVCSLEQTMDREVAPWISRAWLARFGIDQTNVEEERHSDLS